MSELPGMWDEADTTGGETDDSPIIEYTPHDMTRKEYLKLIHEYNLPDAGNSGTH